MGSISTKSGIAPAYNIQLALAKNVIGVVMIISPSFQPNARPAKCNAAVPLDVATAYLEPTKFEIFSSNLLT